jgi:hypothetical protein
MEPKAFELSVSNRPRVIAVSSLVRAKESAMKEKAPPLSSVVKPAMDHETGKRAHPFED